MPDDLPAIDPSLDAPLPQMDPNSALVPYRMSRTEPGGQPIVTTGYGPRARPPIQPPPGFGGGVGMPDLDRIYNAAFSNLPVDDAIKAVNMATKFLGQRMLNQALSVAKTPEEINQAYGRYGYLAFGSGAAVPEILRATMQQAKMAQPTIHQAGGGLYRIPQTGPAETLVQPKPVAPKLHFNNTTGEVLQENPDGTIKQVRAPKEVSESGPVQGQPVLDPETKKPIEGLIATPSAGGKGMTVRLTPKAQAELTPSTAAEYFKVAPDIDRMTGMNPKAPGSFTRRMATNMVDIASQKTVKKEPTNPAKTQTKTQGKQQKFKDKSGKVWVYTGESPTPATDKDPAHWEEE